MEGLCSAYKEHVKDKRSGEQSGSNAAKRGKQEKEDGKMFGVSDVVTYTCINQYYTIDNYVYRYSYAWFLHSTCE